MEQFRYGDFCCDVEIFHNLEGKTSKSVFRFFDILKEEGNYHFGGFVLADPGYGFLCLNVINHDSTLISGYLDKKVFSSAMVIDKMLEYLERIMPDIRNTDVRYHVECVDFDTYYEYNGEYSVKD